MAAGVPDERIIRQFEPEDKVTHSSRVNGPANVNAPKNSREETPGLATMGNPLFNRPI